MMMKWKDMTVRDKELFLNVLIIGCGVGLLAAQATNYYYSDSTGLILRTEAEYKRGFMDAKSQGITDMQNFVKENVVCQYVMNGTACDFKFVQCKANYRVAA